MTGRISAWVGAVAILSLAGCETPSRSGITTINVIGPAGSTIHGSLLQDGQRVPLAGSLPLTLARDGISEVEILKDRPDQVLALAAQKDHHVWHWESYSDAKEGVAGFRVHLGNGVCIEKLKP